MKTVAAILIGFVGLILVHEAQFEASSSSYGYPALAGQFPWHARVESGVSVCGGVLLDKHWVLTLSPCVLGGDDLVKVFLGGITTDTIEVGRVEIQSRVALVRPHNYTIDAAMIFLLNGVELNRRIQPIRLPKSEQVLPNITKLIFSSNNMKTDNTTETSGSLQYVHLATIPQAECTAAYGERINDIMFCTKADPQTSSCYGKLPCVIDAGSPLVLYEGVEEPTLYGIAAFTSDNCTSNSTEYPMAHVGIAPIAQWVRAIAGVD